MQTVDHTPFMQYLNYILSWHIFYFIQVYDYDYDYDYDAFSYSQREHVLCTQQRLSFLSSQLTPQFEFTIFHIITSTLNFQVIHVPVSNVLL